MAARQQTCLFRVLVVLWSLYVALGSSDTHLSGKISPGVAQWQSMNPGGGGAIQDIVPDPNRPGRLWEVSDMEGINVSPDMGRTWRFVDGPVTGEMLAVAVEPVSAADAALVEPRVYAAGIYAVQKSEDGGRSWEIVPGTLNNTLGLVKVFPLNTAVVFFCPGWNDKQSLGGPVGIVTAGQRSLLYTLDGGASTRESIYEDMPGYRQVYSLEFDLAKSCASTAVVYVGAHSGVYQGVLNISEGSLVWRRLSGPASVVPGLRDNSTRVGGCRGAAVSHDGHWLYASWVVASMPQLDGIDRHEATAGCTNTRLSAIFALRVSAPSSEWEEVSAGLNSAPCAVWSVPKLSPWKQSTSHQLVVGTFKGARVGLWLGEFQLSGDQLTGIFSL